MVHDQKAIELAEAIPDHAYRVVAGAELGLCYLRQGHYARALSELETCLRVRAEQQVIEPNGLVTTLNDLAEAHLWLAERDASQRDISLNKAKSACQAALRAAAKFRFQWPEAMRLQGTYEWLCRNPAAAQKRWAKSLAEAERMGLRYYEGLIHLEMGQRLGERAHLEKAEKIFAEIGAELDLAITRKRLEEKMEA